MVDYYGHVTAHLWNIPYGVSAVIQLSQPYSIFEIFTNLNVISFHKQLFYHEVQLQRSG